MSSADQCPPLISEIILSDLDLGSTLGTLNVGVSLSTILYGITCCQVFYYYRSSKYKQDSWLLKALVGFLMALVTFQQALITEACYYYLVLRYDDPCGLLKIVWPAMTSILLECVVEVFVKCFLTHRVWMLGHSLYATGLCAIIVATDFGLSLVIVVDGFKDPSVFGALFGLQPKAIASFGVSTLADMVLVVSIITYLYRSRRGIRRSDDMISKLMILTVSTGLLTTIILLVGLILYAVSPGAFYSVAVEFVVCKLYLNSLLTTLNMRDTLLARRSDSATLLMNTIPLSDIGGGRKTRTPQVNVCISRAVESNEDQMSTSMIPDYATEKPKTLANRKESEVEDLC